MDSRTARRSAVELGFETTVDDKPETFPASFPMSQIAIYCGWYDGDVSGPFTLPKVEFMPGAFAYHLHSFSAATLRSTTENWCGPLLAKGATCTMGCVYEPYLPCTPNVAALSGALDGDRFHLWRGRLGGAAGACPGRPPSSAIRFTGRSANRRRRCTRELARDHNPLIEWSYLRVAESGARPRRVHLAVANYLENLDATTNSAVLTEKLADLYEREGKPVLGH